MITSAGSLYPPQNALDAQTNDGWTLWFGGDGSVMMLPLVGGDQPSAAGTPASVTPTVTHIPTSTTVALTSQTITTTTSVHPSPSLTPSAATSSALASSVSLPKGAIVTIIIVGTCAVVAVAVWVLTCLCRTRRRRAHELEDGESYYPFGTEFGLFRGVWSRPTTPSTPSLKWRPAKSEREKSVPPTPRVPEPVMTLEKEISEKVMPGPLPKRLSDGPYPTTLQLPDGFAEDDPFPAPQRTMLTIVNRTPYEENPTGCESPFEHVALGSPHPAALFKTTPRSPWTGSVDGFHSPAVVISSPTTASVTSEPPPVNAPEDSWNTFKRTVSSAITTFSSQFSRPPQVHMQDSFTRSKPERSQSLRTTSSASSAGSTRRARALDRAQMARVISLDREAQRKADLARQESAPSVSSGLPSPHISTPNPFEETIRFESPAPMNGLVRSASQIERLGPKRMDTTSSSYSRSSFR